MNQLATEDGRADLAQRLEKAQQPLFDGQGSDPVRVIVSLVRNGMVEEARQMCLLDWEKLADLPVVGTILAKELIPEEFEAVTKFRIKMEET